MTHEKLVKLWIKSYSGIPNNEIANDLLTALILIIKTALMHNKEVEFISLGRLKPIIRKGGKNYNYKTGKFYSHKDKFTVKFEISKSFKETLNAGKKI